MNDKEMSAMFAEILEQMKTTNKNLEMLTNTLTKHSDLLAKNNEIGDNLRRVMLNLGAVMAQGLSANVNGQMVEKAVGFFINRLIK